MARRRSALWTLLVAIIVLPVGVVGGARLARRTTSPPVSVTERVQRERNLFSDLYGARTDDGGVILFDAGLDPAGGALDMLLVGLGASRDDVRQVFLTHGHFDHVASAPLCGHAKIRVGAPDVDFMAKRVPIVAPWPGQALSKLFPVPAVLATDPMTGKLEIPVGHDKVLAIPLPGHTPGSYVYVFDKVLFAGDSITINGDELGYAMASFSVDNPANHKAIAALGDALAGVDVQTVCTGHQGCTKPGRAPSMLAALVAKAKAEQ